MLKGFQIYTSEIQNILRKQQNTATTTSNTLHYYFGAGVAHIYD
jgi:hypothetical protein